MTKYHESQQMLYETQSKAAIDFANAAEIIGKLVDIETDETVKNKLRK